MGNMNEAIVVINACREALTDPYLGEDVGERQVLVIEMIDRFLESLERIEALQS